MRNRAAISRTNVRVARTMWGNLPKATISSLRALSEAHALLVARGDLQLLDGQWYVTHSGLLRMALRNRCLGISTSVQTRLCEPGANRWVFKAIVYKSSPASRGFVGYGDADPSNVSSLVHGAEMRVAETRAVCRALRKAYGVGITSVEELGWAPRSNAPAPPDQHNVPVSGSNGHQNGQPRLRDRLCLLIRQYKLDANLVKVYAADFCGTPALRDASRDQIEAFINNLAERAAKNRDGLICQLNSYSKSEEVAR